MGKKCIKKRIITTFLQKKKKKKKKLKLCQIIQVVTIHHFIFKGGDLQNHVLKRKTRIFDSKEIPVQAPKDLDFLSF